MAASMAEAAMIEVFMGVSPWVGLNAASRGQTRVTSGAAARSHGCNLGPGPRRRKCPLFIISIAPVHERRRLLPERSKLPRFLQLLRHGTVSHGPSHRAGRVM